MIDISSNYVTIQRFIRIDVEIFHSEDSIL